MACHSRASVRAGARGNDALGRPATVVNIDALAYRW